MRKLIDHVREEMEDENEYFTKPVGKGRKSDAASRAGYFYDLMVQNANVYMVNRPPPVGRYDFSQQLMKRVKDTKAAAR